MWSLRENQPDNAPSQVLVGTVSIAWLLGCEDLVFGIGEHLLE